MLGVVAGGERPAESVCRCDVREAQSLTFKIFDKWTNNLRCSPDKGGLDEVLADAEGCDEDATPEPGEEVLVGLCVLLDQVVGTQALDEV